ncbi:TPA: DotU family type IV/VI secretion system protein [bacterium]|nr:DotU family type IV/VI secretion system protein [bacterium]
MGSSGSRIENTNLPDLFSDLFTLILYLRETSDFGDPKKLHDKIDSLFKAIEAKSKQLNISEEDFLDAKYAVSALVDETVLYSSWPQRSVWLSNPMAVEYFNDALAGEIFFERLERIRKDESKINVLEVYYLCLMFGFEGRFKIQTPEELRDYINGIRAQLNFKDTEKLSPHAEPQKISIKKRTLIPKWAMYASFGLVALIAIVIFIILKINMISLANTIADSITKMWS